MAPGYILQFSLRAHETRMRRHYFVFMLLLAPIRDASLITCMVLSRVIYLSAADRSFAPPYTQRKANSVADWTQIYF